MVRCHSCGKTLGVFEPHLKYQKDGQTYCQECGEKVLQKDAHAHQTQLPEADEPLVCSFQRRFSTPYRVQCALTAIGDGGVISRAFVNYEPCKIDICPMYQNWKRGDKARLIPI